ncbi:MAG: biotin/lipoyl-binding protein, partial [Aliarcobacter sp.]|nr:biotin/lipoyl-binding protein [Aliarcobacter sp.]
MNKAPNDNTSELIKVGYRVIIIVFILLGCWVSYAPLAIYSAAIGKVSADFNKKRIQHLEGGIIRTIFVKDGDLVKKGQILIKLDDTQTKSELEILESQYQSYIALEARLIAQKNNKKEIILKEEIKNQKIFDEEKYLFKVTIESIEKNKQIIQNQISQLKKQIKGLNFTLKNKNFMLNSIKEEINELEILYKKELINKINLRKFKRDESQLESDIINTEQEIIKLKDKINELKNKNILIDK